MRVCVYMHVCTHTFLMNKGTRNSATVEIAHVGGHEIFMVTEVRVESEGAIRHS